MKSPLIAVVIMVAAAHLIAAATHGKQEGNHPLMLNLRQVVATHYLAVLHLA